ncbi:hypothetical protein QTP86_005965 [Hemibagrus guttatus]|nr:hypothetical protein QTP86_005965 [Hemibagrus guttatus]
MKATILPRARRDSCSCAELSAEPDLCCLQHDMNDCYSRLKRLVPTIPQHRRVSRVEILQHVIDYILDLQLALERTERTDHTEHTEHSGTWLRSSIRTPLSALNTEQRKRRLSGIFMKRVVRKRKWMLVRGTDKRAIAYVDKPDLMNTEAEQEERRSEGQRGEGGD